MTEWRPIETAPNDTVLLYFPALKRGTPETWLRPMMKVDHPRCTTRKPTHWMPLPNPPEEYTND